MPLQNKLSSKLKSITKETKNNLRPLKHIPVVFNLYSSFNISCMLHVKCKLVFFIFVNLLPLCLFLKSISLAFSFKSFLARKHSKGQNALIHYCSQHTLYFFRCFCVSLFSLLILFPPFFSHLLTPFPPLTFLHLSILLYSFLQ